MMQFLKLKILGRSLAAISLAWGSSAWAQDAGADKVQCFNDGEPIFTSSSGDIEAFDANAYGVTLALVQPQPEHGITIYAFKPGNIVCVVRDE